MWKRTGVVGLVCCANVMLPDLAFAEDPESRSFLRQVLIMWLPLAAMVGVWVWAIRRSKFKRHGQLIERSFIHMDALEAKLDRLIELLETERRSK